MYLTQRVLGLEEVRGEIHGPFPDGLVLSILILAQHRPLQVQRGAQQLLAPSLHCLWVLGLDVLLNHRAHLPSDC